MIVLLLFHVVRVQFGPRLIEMDMHSCRIIELLSLAPVPPMVALIFPMPEVLPGVEYVGLEIDRFVGGDFQVEEFGGQDTAF